MRIAAAIALIALSVVAQDDMMEIEEQRTGISQTEQVRSGLMSYWSMRQIGTQVVDEVGSNPLNVGSTCTTAISNGVVGAGADIGALPTTALGLYSSGVYTIAPPFSVSLWYAFGGDADFANVFGIYAPASGGVLFDQRPSIAQGLRLLFEPGSVATVIPLADTTPLNYVHAIWSAAGSNHSVYINGSFVTSVVYSLSTLTNYIYFGFRPDTTSGNDNFGKRDEIRIYNRAIEADEAHALYRMGESLRGVK